MTKVKICGITNLEDALLSAKFGADALGFNFYAKSPRYIAPEKARHIIEQLPNEILKVGVFVNETLDKIAEVAEIAKLDALQLHGEETPEFTRELKQKTHLEIIKAFRVLPAFAPEDVLQYEVDAILLDAYDPKEHGGTGETFDWKLAFKVKQLVPKLFLAGGLSSRNVELAIRRVQPFGVDACSLLEKEKGKKDKFKVLNFISAIKKPPKFEINNIYDLLFLVEHRPVMYLGKPSITGLYQFLWGIEFALKYTDIEKSNFDWKQFKPKEEPSYLFGFQNWIAGKLLNQDKSAYHWDYIILCKTKGDESKALNLFFELLEEFKLEKEDLGLKTNQWEKASDEDLQEFEKNLNETH